MAFFSLILERKVTFPINSICLIDINIGHGEYMRREFMAESKYNKFEWITIENFGIVKHDSYVSCLYLKLKYNNECQY